MFCSKKDDHHSESEESKLSSKSKVGIAAVTGSLGAFLAPHLLCVAGLSLGGLSIGGYKIYENCTEHTSEFSTKEKISLTKLQAVPDDPQSFPEQKNARAAEILLERQPVFREVIEFKRIESEGAPIQVVFMEDTKKDVSVVFCKNGMMCPCSKPEVYQIGTKKDLLNDQEGFSGQHEILSALYSPEFR